MAKRKKSLFTNRLVFPLSLIIIIFSAFVILRITNFNEANFLLRNKPIPFTSELPKEIKESIKNIKPQKSFRVPILLHHYVEYVKDQGDTIRKSLNILPYTFDQEVKTLKDAGYVFITTKDLADALDDKITLPPKSVILTFDDGYRDFYTDVFPIIKKYQVRAVAYIVPNFLDKPNNLTTWQLREIAKSGLVEIGAHTMDHSYLRGLSKERVKYEVEESKKYLENIINSRIVSFAYPYGVFDNQAISIVKEAGFTSAVTTISGIYSLDINRFFLYRIRPGGRVGQVLLGLLENKNLSLRELPTIPKN